MADSDGVPHAASNRNSDAPEESAHLPPDQSLPRPASQGRRLILRAAYSSALFALGLGAGFAAWGPPQLLGARRSLPDATALAREVNPPVGYTLPVSLGDVGPRLLAAGAIDEAKFRQVYEQAGQPLSADQLAALERGSSDPVVINSKNAYFLLNFLWALGLTNDNPLLEQGRMGNESGDQIARYASTGGWTLATKPISQLYASTPIVTLTAEQQARLEEVATAAYRPCCNNPTSFPDCNHGMALLGLLELMAAQGASTEDMFRAAKEMNAFWFPQQAFDLATYFHVTTGRSFDKVDARQAVGSEYFSAAGMQTVVQYLSTKGLLLDSPSAGSGCGV